MDNKKHQREVKRWNMKTPHNEQLDNSAGSRIRAGQRVHIRREWQDAGDDKFIWVALEDEDGGRVGWKQNSRVSSGPWTASQRN